MRINISGYEVEVKAKGYGSTRFNKQDTMAFLCSLCVEMIQARDMWNEKHLDACADVCEKNRVNIYTLLEENNYSPTK